MRKDLAEQNYFWAAAKSIPLGGISINKPLPFIFAGSYGKFDGASQGLDCACGIGAFIFLNSYYYLNLWMNVCMGTNTKSEVCALWCLLYFAKFGNLTLQQIAGDSQVVINWINVLGPLQVISLSPWLVMI